MKIIFLNRIERLVLAIETHCSLWGTNWIFI